MPAVRLLALLSLAVAASGCVSPHLDGLATADCVGDDDCDPTQVCRAGACALPVEVPDGGREDVDPPDVEVDGGDGGEVDEGMGEAGPAPDEGVDEGCAPVDEVCNGVDDDCDEAVDEGDPAVLCALDGVAAALCSEGACAVETCADERVDVDGIAANGCECISFARFFREIGEAPAIAEPAGLDLDCDGLGGRGAEAIFVSLGADAATADGTAANPYRLIDDALVAVGERLAAGERVALILGAGTHRQAASVSVEAGAALHVFGGFSHDAASGWRRSGSEATIVAGATANPAFGTRGDGVLVIDGVRLRTLGASRPLAIRAAGCGHLEIAAAALSVEGQPGTGTAQGGTRVNDAPAADESATAGTSGGADGTPGAGGENAACAVGSAGGAGGQGNTVDMALSGEDGATGSAPSGVDPAAGGAGATSASAAEAGARGPDGAPGSAGEPGAPGGLYDVDGGAWRSHLPTRAAPGQVGGGGGGGGGGVSPADVAPPGGGGGGAGGCAGRAGPNGNPGLASTGILVTGSCTLRLDATQIEVAPGGPGSAGGRGGTGGRGASGGEPGPVAPGAVSGGFGGDGGRGGCGGAGAGGDGGASFGVLLVGPDAVLHPRSTVAITVGEPAPGGAGASAACIEATAAPAGNPGPALTVACCLDPADCGSLACPE